MGRSSSGSTARCCGLSARARATTSTLHPFPTGPGPIRQCSTPRNVIDMTTDHQPPTTQLPVLPTAVIGSYSMPEWLERAKNDYLSRRLSKRDLDEMHEAVRK